MGIVESGDKGFVLDLKLFFIIVNCFLGRFSPLRFFTVKLVCFIDFLGSSYLILLLLLHDFDMILMFVCFSRFSHNKSY